MSLARVLANYLRDYENNQEHSTDQLSLLRVTISLATLSEIVTEFNKLSHFKLWFPPVVIIFQEELLARANQATFMFSTSWTNIETYSPFVDLQVGYQDEYVIPDENGSPISSEDWSIYSLVNDNLVSIDQEKIIRMILTGPIIADIIQTEDQISIGSISSEEDPVQTLTFNSQTGIKVKVKITYLDDFNVIKTALDSLKSNYQLIEVTQ